jgi:hypothetical protein
MKGSDRILVKRWSGRENDMVEDMEELVVDEEEGVEW